MRRREGDRRGRPRFEIVGDLFGTFETILRLPLRNLGPNGALLESAVPLAVGSVYSIACGIEGTNNSTQIRVRHIQSATAAGGERTYLIGVEFIARSRSMTEQIQRWILNGPAIPEYPGASS